MNIICTVQTTGQPCMVTKASPNTNQHSQLLARQQDGHSIESSGQFLPIPAYVLTPCSQPELLLNKDLEVMPDPHSLTSGSLGEGADDNVNHHY